MARPLTLAAAIAVSLLFVSGAGGSPAQTPKRGGTLVVGTLAEPPCLNAFLLRCTGGTPVVNFLTSVPLRGAFQAGPGTTFLPDLVTHVERPKGRPLTLRYHIRPQARWSDGTPITARDFVFTHVISVSKHLEPVDRAFYRQVRSARPIDAKTVEVVLRSSFSNWRALFADVLPWHALRAQNFSKVWLSRIHDPRTGEPIGSGPFLLERWDRGSRLVYRPNPNYWGARPYLDRLEFRFCQRCGEMAAEQAEWLRAGELDLVQSMGFLSAEGLRAFRTRGVTVAGRPGNAWEQLSVRVGAGGHPALDRRLVRQALVYGIDRGAIAPALYGLIDRRYPPMQSSVLLRGDVHYQPNWDGHRYRPARARRLLEQAGCTLGADGIYACDGRRLSLRFVTAAGVEPFVGILALVPRQLRRAGIEVVPQYVPFPTLVGQVVPSGSFDAVLFAWIRGPLDDGSDLAGLYECGGTQNFMGYCDRLVTAGLDRARRMPDAARRARILNRVDARLARDVPVIPIVQNPFVVAYREGVRGVDLTGALYPLVNAEKWWLD
ncbi:MAG TPA: ABC transporter substrate-binding protein, partial [Longimicrobiales bacterium]|nr:ABC transporter substrate-binding protein [Longimicrobiales bacterium]